MLCKHENLGEDVYALAFKTQHSGNRMGSLRGQLVLQGEHQDLQELHSETSVSNKKRGTHTSNPSAVCGGGDKSWACWLAPNAAPGSVRDSDSRAGHPTSSSSPPRRSLHTHAGAHTTQKCFGDFWWELVPRNHQKLEMHLKLGPFLTNTACFTKCVDPCF